MKARPDDPKLSIPQCASLLPVETVHENPWFLVKNRGGYYTIEYQRPQSTVLPIVDNRSIVMVRVKRPVIADSTWELPAGGAKVGEAPLEAAARELAEETGIQIQDLAQFEPLPPLAVTSRYSCLIHIFQVHLTAAEYDVRGKHDSEIEAVGRFTFNEILKMIADGEIYMSFPIAILSRYFLKNGSKFLLRNGS